MPQNCLKLTRLTCLALVAQASVAAPCHAQPADAALYAEHEARFRAADLDGSKGLSREELKQGMPTVLLRHFDDIDANHDGELSPEELMEMRTRERLKREARRRAKVQELQGR